MKAVKDFNKIERVSAAEFKEITEVWEASVRATHHFLREEDILYYKSLITSQYLQAVDLFCIKDKQNKIAGFLGTHDDKVEMLFINPESRGKGIGKLLLSYAVNILGMKKVDVNEQNIQAVGFYKYCGFEIMVRSALDGMGKPYPILNLELINK